MRAEWQRHVGHIISAIFIYVGFFTVLILLIIFVPSPWKVLILPMLAVAWLVMLKS